MSSICTTLKEAFSKCSSSSARRPSLDGQSDDGSSSSYVDRDRVIVQASRSRASSKTSLSLKSSSSRSVWDGFKWNVAFGPKLQEVEDHMVVIVSQDDDEAYFSVRSSLSRCSSIESQDLKDNGKCWWLLMNEVGWCEGWPFGLLVRKMGVLPPLPSSPSESWAWRRGSSRSSNWKF